MKTFLIALLAVSQLVLSKPAIANDNISAEIIVLQAGLEARDSFVSALERKDFAGLTHQTMGDAVALLVQDLRERSDEQMATELNNAWKESESLFFSNRIFDLGDHDPLLPQLEAVFVKLSVKYGAIILALPLFQDIRNLNFALAVVLHPRGAWQSPDYDNRIEYRKHFIPFANIVTYYGVLIGCNYMAKKQGQNDDNMKKLCKTAAEKLKFVMGRYIAPQVSDFIFKQLNKTITISQSSRRYNTAQELREAIKPTTLIMEY